MELAEYLDSSAMTKLKPYRRKIQERSGKLPKSHRWFLMNKLFNLMPIEIARMEGLKNSDLVYKGIKAVADGIITGELDLIEATEEEKEAARARIEAKRQRDRDFRARNLERERAKDREQYSRKKARSLP